MIFSYMSMKRILMSKVCSLLKIFCMTPKMKLLLPVFFTFILQSFAQNAELKSGPMLGYSEMREVVVWLQTTSKGKVQLNYWNLEAPNKVFKSNVVETDASAAFTTKIVLSLLEPGNKYVK